MDTATNGTNNVSLLDQYDSLTQKRLALHSERERLTVEMETVDRSLSEIRDTLRIKLAGVEGRLLPPGPTSRDSHFGEVPTVGRRRGRKSRQAKSHAATKTNYKARLKDQDPRVQRSLSEVFRTLDRAGVRRTDVKSLAKLLKISKEAARQRLSRAVTLGFFEKKGRSEFERTV